MIASHFSIGKSSIGETNWMPALLTRMSSEPSFSSRLDHRRDLGGLGHVGAVVERPDAEVLLDAGALGLDRGGLAHAVEDDIGAVLGERARDREPDAAGRSRDQGVAFGKGHPGLLKKAAGRRNGGDREVILLRSNKGERLARREGEGTYGSASSQFHVAPPRPRRGGGRRLAGDGRRPGGEHGLARPAAGRAAGRPREIWGAWYIVANIPNWFEAPLVGLYDIYSRRPDGDIAENFYTHSGSFRSPLEHFEVHDWVEPGTNNAKWRVQVMWPLNFPFWVLWVDPDDQYVLFGYPDRSLGWIFARRQTIDEPTYQALLARFAALGYDPSKFRRIVQLPAQIGQKGFGGDLGETLRAPATP